MRPSVRWWCVFIVGAGGCTAPAPVDVRLDTDPDGRAVVVAVFDGASATSLTEDEASLLEVFVVADGERGSRRRSLLGTRSVAGDAVRFRPRYDFRPGQAYLVHYAGRSVHEFALPDLEEAPPTTVLAVHPRSQTLPENLLRFYLHFSAPMSRGDIYRSLHLLREDGTSIEGALLEIGQELWDPSLTRLTLLLDPGRVKTDLVPRQSEGPILEAGKRYALRVDRSLLDARSRELAADFEFSFTAVEADRLQPDPAQWSLELPEVDTLEPLVVRFDEALDHEMLQRVLSVRHESGARVGDSPGVDPDGHWWSLAPLQPWQEGDYELQFDRALEDLAGNSIERPFEVDLFDSIEESLHPRLGLLRFHLARPNERSP